MAHAGGSRGGSMAEAEERGQFDLQVIIPVSAVIVPITRSCSPRRSRSVENGDRQVAAAVALATAVALNLLHLFSGGMLTRPSPASG
jgi:hypothetical protein